MNVESKGMTFDRNEVEWKKSPQSGAIGNCVEVAHLPGSGVAMRDSEHPDGALLVFTSSQWDAFAAGMASGFFDRS